MSPQPFSTLKGFGVTFKQIFKKPITQQYPEYKRPLYPRFRGRHRLWRHEKWNPLEAFRHAWQSVRSSSPSLRGSGLVLWSRRPLVQVVSERVAYGVSTEWDE